MINAHKDKHPLDIAYAENRWKCKYVGEFCMPAKGGGWTNFPASIFFGEKHPQGSEYLAIVTAPNPLGEAETVLMDGLPAVKEPFHGLYNPETDEFTYSAFRHDFQTLESNTESMSVDGGRDYFKVVGNPLTSNIHMVQLKVHDGKIMLDNSAEVR